MCAIINIPQFTQLSRFPSQRGIAPCSIHWQAPSSAADGVPVGFPLTDAQVSSSYTVLTAHAPDQVDWAKFAGLDTLVLLMAARNLHLIMQHLLRTGWSPQTPVSVCVSV